MKSRLLAAIALTATVSFASSGYAPAQVRDPHHSLPGGERSRVPTVLRSVAIPAAGSISGTVYESDGVTPITTTARVEALDADTGMSMGFDLVDSVGMYMIGGLADGAYRVNATAPGRAREFYDAAGANFADATRIVVAGGDIANINFTLELGGTIEGIVYAADGVTPLGNVSVGSDFAWGVSCSFADGTYKLSYLPLNTPLKVRASGQDLCPADPSYVQEWWKEASNYDLATPIALTAGYAVKVGIDFTLQTGGSISGHVFEAGGTTPIEGALVLAEHLGTGNGNSDRTDSSGHYQIDGLSVGNYRVRAEANGYALEFYYNAGPHGADATPVGVTGDGNTPNINFTLDPGGTISGVVYSADGVTPMAHMNVGLGTTSSRTCTNLSGAYTISNVPLFVPHKVFAGGDNWCPAGLAGYVQEWWLEAFDLTSANPITLTSGTPYAAGVDFTLMVKLYLPVIQRSP